MTYGKPVAIVEWMDACKYDDGSERPRHEAYRLLSVGWVLQYDDDGISLAEELSALNEHEWRYEHFIPAAMIVSVTYLPH